MKPYDGPLAVAFACLMGTVLSAGSNGYAMTQILPEATIEVDRQTVLELTSTFDQAEEAIRSRDVDDLMSLYSDRYSYHGMKKADIRRIWAELLEDYDFVSNIHTFSAIRAGGEAGGPILEITCTGALWARSKDSKERIPIDSWHQETHHLVKEDGAWRIIGSAGAGKAPRRPRMFGTAPHPLF